LEKKKMFIRQGQYANGTTESANRMAKAIAADPAINAACKAARELPPEKWSPQHPLVQAAYRGLIKAGVTTALGFNFYDLRGPAYFIFPVNTPFVQLIGREGAVNAGVGTVAHWKATRNVNSTYVYAGVQEGQRNAIATPDEIDYLATYKELGMDAGETFTAQYAGEGYTDNLADEHFRSLARLRLQEEMMILWGNSGTAAGNHGFALGQATTPGGVVTNTAVGSLGNGTNVFVAVVAITGFGMNAGGQAGYAAPPSVANGLTTNYIRTNADGSTTNVSCGISAISNVSALFTVNAATNVINVSIAPMKGAVAYAWFWGTNVASSVANLKIGAITNWPSYTITAAPTGIQAGNATGLNVDNSFQPTDFDGLGTYTFLNGTWTDMNGGTFTPAGNGQVKEIETDLLNMWTLYQAQPDAIWCSADVRQSLEDAVMYSTSGTNSYIFSAPADSGRPGLMAGFVITGYKSKYSMALNGGQVIPIRIHPMLPPGVLFYDINTNPYPSSRVPGVRMMLTQRDYYSIEWPTVTRQWTFGTYVHEVLAHYMPWITAIRTGIGPFTG
jgi:hypothetical protein